MFDYGICAVNDFSDSSACGYGKWGDGEMNTTAWAYGNGTSTVASVCGGGSWTLAGNVGVANQSGSNAAGFGFSLLGYVHDNTSNSNTNCTVFDLSAYSGLVISLASPSGTIRSIQVGVALADGSKGSKTINVSTTATAVPVTWSDLGISGASQITGIWGNFINGTSDVTSDLVISQFGLQ